MAAKFVSPFISDETEDEVANGGEFTIPDAALFNDSLDEGVDPTALLDDADLPAACAAAEPKPGNLELNDSLNSADDLDETQLPANDDAPTEAAVEMEPATLGVAKTKTVTPPRAAIDLGNNEQSKASPREVSSPSVEKKAKAESCEGKTVAGSTPTVESQASKGVAKVKPSFGKKKKGFTPPKVTAKTATTVPSQSENKQLPKKASNQSSSNASDKNPPQVSGPKVGADSPKEQPHSNMGSDVKTTSEKVPSTEAKKVKVADKKVAVEEKKKEKEKKEQERALKKQAAEQKRLEREKKKAELEHQRNEKRLELERKKAEREQKKTEKDLKKIEREQKKAEKQAKASQKQLTKDKKIEETSSSKESEKKDKVEPRSEKITENSQQESKVDEGDKTGNMMKSGEQALESNIEEKENTPPNKEQSYKVSTKDAAATLSPKSSCGDRSKIQKARLEKADDQQNTDVKEKELVEVGSDDASDCEELAKDTTIATSTSTCSKSNREENMISTPEKGGDEQNICVIEEEGKISPKEKEPGSSEASEQHEEELNKNATTASSPLVSKSAKVSQDGTTKQKEKKVKKFSPPKKAKKDASKAAGKEAKKQRKAVIKMDRVKNLSGAGDGGKQKTQVGGKGKKRKPSVYSDSEDELETKRAKSAENLGSVWVQCENANCKKWRLLRDCDDPGKVPGKWVCSMNTDADHNSCSAEEERWSDLGDSQEFVESPFIPGSLVWSKMDGYPWWPAMIEEDPNKETYYEMGYRDSTIPVRYHVVFFDIPVSRGWVPSLHTLPYTGRNDPNKDGNVNVPQRFNRTLTDGKKQATKALELSLKERLETLSFAKRFRGCRRKRRGEESPEAIPSQAKYRKTTSNGERKSARFRVSSAEDDGGLEGAMPVVNLKPLVDQQPDSEEGVGASTKESCDHGSSSVQQHEE